MNTNKIGQRSITAAPWREMEYRGLCYNRRDHEYQVLFATAVSEQLCMRCTREKAVNYNVSHLNVFDIDNIIIQQRTRSITATPWRDITSMQQGITNDMKAFKEGMLAIYIPDEIAFGSLMKELKAHLPLNEGNFAYFDKYNPLCPYLFMQDIGNYCMKAVTDIKQGTLQSGNLMKNYYELDFVEKTMQEVRMPSASPFYADTEEFLDEYLDR